MKREETAICYIHGRYYSGFCECPTCKAMKEDDTSEYDTKEEGDK